MDISLKKKRFTTQQIATAIVALALLILLIFVYTTSGGNSKLNVAKNRISISDVKTGPFQENIPVSGTVMPITTIYLDALEGGRVEEKYVEDGAIMTKGQPILRLSNTDLELSLINQETSVYNLLTQMKISQNAARQNSINKLNQFTVVENDLVEAKRKHVLNQKLYKQAVISHQDFLETENDYSYQQKRMELAGRILKEDSISVEEELKQAKNSYHRTQIALKLMRKKVGDLVLRAPVNGRLTSLDSEIGQSINKGDRLGQLDVLSGFKVRSDIDEHYIARIYSGQTGTFMFNGNKFTLVIKKVFTQVTNGRFQVNMLFSELPEGIRQGQSLQIRLALSDEKQAILIPKGGFFQHTGGIWIFKLSDDGRIAYKTDLRLGSQNTDYYEVLSGLEPGDKVITSGYDNYGDIQELILK